MLLLSLLAVTPVHAQEHAVVFGPTDPGVTRSITNWGLDTCWPNYDNMQRGLLYMGTNNVNIVRVGFFVDAPLTNNDVTPADKSAMQTDISLASMATAATKLDLNLNSSVSSWYQSGVNTVYPDRWAAAMEACQRYYNMPFWAAEGFNEPDYTANNEGSPQNLYDIFGYLQSSTNFVGTLMEGGSTLNDDVALSTWFDAISPRATIGSTHCLAGSAASYVNFIQSVTASNAIPFNPELHNVVEAIMGANYGLQGGIWWGTAERARGDFVKACQGGQQLAYADDLNNWTAAAVYRRPSGKVQAFIGASERMATTTTYRFFSKDRRVFFDGHGPQFDYAATIPGGTGYQQNQPSAERVVNITWGADAPPAINGEYLIVNRNSGLVLEVPGGSRTGGTQLDQNTYTGAQYQLWNVNPVPSTNGGDYSYFTMTAAHDGFSANDNNNSYSDGSAIIQWSGATLLNAEWYLQYVGNGYFKIVNRWSHEVMGVLGASTSTGAQIVQWSDTGSPDQQWRLIPASVSTYDFVPPAAPTGVTAVANPVSVTLSWNANTESDLAGYTVLRAMTSGGPYDIVARGLANTTFTDGSVLPAQTYYYVVAADDTSLNQSAYSSEVSATPTGGQALLANYNFENNSLDSSGNGNNAELVGSPGYATGVSGSAISLNGSGQSVIVPAGIMDNVTNFTIAAWVYWNGGNAWQRIFDFGNGTGQYMFLSPDSGNGTLRFAITTNGNGAEQQLNAAPLSTAQWIHVAVTYDGTTASLYTNGVLAASGPVSISPAAFNPAANFLGQSQWPGDPTLNGVLDSVYIYNYALTGSQIANLAGGIPPNNNAPSAPTALAAAAGNQVVNLTWTQSTSSGITGDNVYRSTTGSGGPYTLIASLGATTSYSDTSVTGGNTYYYAVTAVNSSGESAMSAYAGATTPTITYYKFQNRATGLYIDGMGDTANGSDCNQWSGDSSYNQQWAIVPDGSYVRLQNRATGLFIDGMGLTSNGSNAAQWGDSNSSNQQWSEISKGNYTRFQNRATGLYLDGMGRTSNGSILGQWSNSRSQNQQWSVQAQ